MPCNILKATSNNGTKLPIVAYGGSNAIPTVGTPIKNAANAKAVERLFLSSI